MALPNINSVQQAGVDPVEIQSRRNDEQKMMEILDNIQTRLSNITNMRSNIQTATFDAFGNNFISRTMSQVMDSTIDTLHELIVGKKEDKDPVLDNAKEQTRLLNHLVSITVDSHKTLEQIDDSIINVRRDIKNIFDKGSAKDTGHDSTTPETPMTPSSGIPEIEPFPSIVPPDIFVNRTNIPALENNPSPVFGMQPPEERVIIGQPIDKPPPPVHMSEPADAEARKSVKPLHEAHEQHVEKLLTDIVHVMTRTNQSIDDLLRVVPISTQESELENTPQKPSTLSSRVDTSSVEDAHPPGSNKFDWSRLITGWFDMDANIRGVNNIIKGLGSALSKISTALSTSLTTILPSVGTALAASAPMAAMYGVTKWAENASITDENDDLTATGTILDKAQTALGNPSLKPQTSIISSADRIAQEADTGFFDIFGTKKNAYKKRYQEKIDLQQSFSRDEADALKKNFDLTVPEKQIIQNANSLVIQKTNDDKVGMLDEKQKELTTYKDKPKSSENVNVNNTSVVNNQTILPGRTSTKNNDDSYNRYLNRVMT